MIIGSICTVPDRSDSLIRVLGSLNQQSVKLDKIVINISEFYPRLGKFYKSWEFEKVSKFLETYPIQTLINKIPLDYGPTAKLLEPLKILDLDGEDFILTYDDDNIPNDRAIEMLLRTYKKFPKSIYGIMGVRNGNYYHTESVKENYPLFEYFVVDVLGGFRGVLYKRNLIGEDFFDWTGEIIQKHRERDLIAMHDDQIFSLYFKWKGIQRRVAEHLGEVSPLPYIPIDNENGIFKDSKVQDCYDFMLDIIRERGLDWVIDNEF